MSISRHRNIPSTAPHQASRDSQGHVRNKSRFANPFKESQDQLDQIPSIRPMNNPSIALKLEPRQSFKKALKSLGEFSQFSTPLSSPSRKDLPVLTSDQTPSRTRAMTSHSNINTYYAGSVNAIPCPSLTNILENLSKKSSDRPTTNGLAGSQNSTGSNHIYKLTTLGGKMRGYSFKSHFGHHKNNISNSSDSFSHNQPSIEEDFVQRSHRAASENKNIFAKPSNTPSKCFLSPKSMSTRNVFNPSATTTNGLFTRDRIQQEHHKKPSMFDFIKEKADQQIQTQYPKITRDKRPKWKVPLSIQTVNPLMETPKDPKIILKSYNDDIYLVNDKEKEKERPATQATPLKNEDPVQTAVSTPLTTRKRDMKVTMKYNCNFTMAKIEKQALKELKAKRSQGKLLVKFEKPQVREELDHSPLKARPNRFNHPLFDTDDIEIPNEERTRRTSERRLNPGGIEGRILRRRLIQCLNKMKRLKINPKDLLKCEKIFSTVPFEKEGSKKLIAAAKCGDKDAILELLDKKNRYLVYDFDQTHQTALHWATRKGYEEIVEILIARGADVNAKDISGRTALYHALKANHILVVKQLLANQADPWSNKDCNYMELAKDNPTVKHYLSKAKQLHILIKMTPPQMRDIMWEKEGLRLLVNINFNIDNLKVYSNPQ